MKKLLQKSAINPWDNLVVRWPDAVRLPAVCD
jgi:hypothetical protein